MRSFAFILLSLIGLCSIGYSQSTYKVENTNDIGMKLMGTSTLHDWEMESRKMTGVGEFVFESGSEKELTSLNSLTFSIEVTDLKSDSETLDKNAYEALKSEDYKDINYKLSASTLSPEKGGFLLKSKGKLTIAGVTKDIVMDVHIVVNTDGTITCKGSYKLNMTDYSVKPPSFMFGAMKTGDAITLDFAVVYKKSKGA